MEGWNETRVAGKGCGLDRENVERGEKEGKRCGTGDRKNREDCQSRGLRDKTEGKKRSDAGGKRRNRKGEEKEKE
jgi:hypothetical protein